MRDKGKKSQKTDKTQGQERTLEKKKIQWFHSSGLFRYINNGFSRRNVKFCAKIRKKFVNGILLIKYHIMGKQYSVQRTSCDIDKFQ